MRRNLRPMAVVVYAAFIGLLLASYFAPVQQIVDGRARVASLENEIQSIEEGNETKTREVEELQKPAGIERAAREHYGMVKPGEEAYIVPEHMKGEDGGE